MEGKCRICGICLHERVYMFFFGGDTLNVGLVISWERLIICRMGYGDVASALLPFSFGMHLELLLFYIYLMHD